MFFAGDKQSTVVDWRKTASRSTKPLALIDRVPYNYWLLPFHTQSETTSSKVQPEDHGAPQLANRGRPAANALGFVTLLRPISLSVGRVVA